MSTSTLEGTNVLRELMEAAAATKYKSQRLKEAIEAAYQYLHPECDRIDGQCPHPYACEQTKVCRG